MNRSEFIRTMNSARNSFVKAQEKEQKIFDELEESFPRLDLSKCITNAENADNVQEAIACFLQYGEYTPEEIWEEIKMADMARS